MDDFYIIIYDILISFDDLLSEIIQSELKMDDLSEEERNGFHILFDKVVENKRENVEKRKKLLQSNKV